MDFDLDDPLGDLLSDGSNDSFFETPTTTKKLQQTKKPAPKSNDKQLKSKVADLFGIDSTASKPQTNELTENTKSLPKVEAVQDKGPLNAFDSKPNPNKDSSNKPISSITRIPSQQNTLDGNIKSMKKEITFDKSDDFLSELGFDPKNPKAARIPNKKANIVDDILNFSKTTNESSSSKPSSALEKRNSPVLGEHQTISSSSINRQKNMSQTNLGSSSNLFELFSTPKKQTQKREEHSALSTKTSSVNWLGLDVDNENKDNELPQTLGSNSAAYTKTEPKLAESKKVISELNISPPKSQTIESAVAQSAITDGLPLKVEQTINSLQQQGNQLQAAILMKQQENTLVGIQKKQQILIEQQEKQFTELVKRQTERQNQLETEIQKQQEQIHVYINALMNQPSLGLITYPDEHSHKENEKKKMNGSAESPEMRCIELEAEIKRLELEKLRLEDVLESIQSTHNKELELLRASHKYVDTVLIYEIF